LVLFVKKGLICRDSSTDVAPYRHVNVWMIVCR